MESSTSLTLSTTRKIAMKLLSVLTLLVCSDCSKVIGRLFDLISGSEDQSKTDKQ